MFLYYFSLVLFTLWSIPFLILSIIFYPYRYELWNLFNRSFLFITGTQIYIDPKNYEILDSLKNKQTIYVVNHLSSFDSLYNLFISTKTVTPIKKSLSYIPFFGQYLYLNDHILIDRCKKCNKIEVITDYLKRTKYNLLIFPEGTRNYTNQLLPFHLGAFQVAKNLNLDIALLYINNREMINDKKKIFNFGSTIYGNVVEIVKTDDFNNANDLKEYCYSKLNKYFTENI